MMIRQPLANLSASVHLSRATSAGHILRGEHALTPLHAGRVSSRRDGREQQSYAE